MKIVRKSSAQATNSSNLENGHGLPTQAARRSPGRRHSEKSESYGVKSADFSRMSGHELHELISCQTRSGQLSLEEASTLAWLLVNARIDDDESMEFDDQDIVDFLERARSGMETALSESNLVVARQFELASDLMHNIQGQTIGVDTLV